MNDLASYYSRRVSEYDAIYDKPERQESIQALTQLLVGLLADRRVLEIACGTGFWTARYSRQSRGVTATDINQSVLDIARKRLADDPAVQLQVSDAFALETAGDGFDGAFAGFWWSHIRLTEIRRFLDGLHARLVPGARVVFIDNMFVPGSNTPISRTDADGNTFQRRRLADGTEYEIVKNFPMEDPFRKIIGNAGDRISFESFQYFWCGWYDLQAAV